jgi:hypothetical protein
MLNLSKMSDTNAVIFPAQIGRTVKKHILTNMVLQSCN